jgi:hypothetical protein
MICPPEDDVNVCLSNMGASRIFLCEGARKFDYELTFEPFKNICVYIYIYIYIYIYEADFVEVKGKKNVKLSLCLSS